jgi:hypothetical protein
VGAELDVSLRDVKDALKGRRELEPVAAETAEPEPEAKPEVPEVEIDAIESAIQRAEQNAMDTSEGDPDSPVFHEVNASTLAGIVDEEGLDVSGHERAQEILGYEREPVEEAEARAKPKKKAKSKKTKPVTAKPEEKAAPVEAEAKPKAKSKKRKTLTDRVEEKEAQAKPKVKKEAQAPVDAAKPVAVPKSEKKKTKTSARQKMPETLSQDKNGATMVKDLSAVMRAADSVEKVEAAFGVYKADIKHGRRKRRSFPLEKLRNERIEDIAGEEVLEAAKPTVAPKARKIEKQEIKETDEAKAERMEQDMNAEWAWPESRDSIEDEYAYFEDLDSDTLEDEIYEEVKQRWMLTNGLHDGIDPHFFNQVLSEIADVNPEANAVAEDVFARLVNEELVDENRSVRWFLVNEYPGALTLKDAEGEPQSKAIKQVGGPMNAFADWLEVSRITEEDAKPERAKALEELGETKVGLTAIDKQEAEDAKPKAKAKPEVEESVDDLLESDVFKDAEAELAAEEEVLSEALERMGETEEGVVEERAKKDYPNFGIAERPFHVPTLADVKRVFKKGWKIAALPNDRGFSLTRESDGMEMQIIFTDVYNVLKEQWEAKKGKPLSRLDLFIVRFLSKIHTRVFLRAQKAGTVLGSKRGAKVPFGTYYRALNGVHIITLDSQLSDNVTLWHESLHMWMRTLATDKEIKLVKRIFETEEEFTGFMGLMLHDEDQAMQMAEESGASQEDQGLLKSLADRIFKLAKQFAEVLGYDVNEREQQDLADLYVLAQKILHGDAYLAPQQRGRYLQDAEWTGLVTNDDGSVYRAGNLSGRQAESVAASPEQVQAQEEERAYERVNAETPSQIPDEPRPLAQDADARPGGAESDGNTMVLDRKRKRKARYLKRLFAQNFKSSRGVPKELRDLLIKMERAAKKGMWAGLAAHNRIKKIVKDLKKQHGEDRVSQSLSMVLDGRMPLSQFARIYGLDPDSKALDSLRVILDFQAEIQQALFENPSIPEKIRKEIIANQFYQTRFYAIHVLGDNFIVPDEHFISAVDAVIEAHQHEIERAFKKANEAIGVRDPFDLATYMFASPARQEAMTQGLSKTRRLMVERAARMLNDWVPTIHHIRHESGQLASNWTVDSLRAVAEQTVLGYLDNAVLTGKRVAGPIGGMPMTNMMHRKLDQVFRDLYGEVLDPGQRMARTMEVQADLLATGMFFQKMFEEGRNVWWSQTRHGEFTHRLSEADKGGKLTPGDRNRYGNMAGKWVTQETYDLLHATGTFDRTLDTGWKKYAQYVQGVTRGTRLIWPKTILRNGFTSVTGFAFRSGDAMRAGYKDRLLEGIKLMGRIDNAIITGNDPEALEILADLVEQDIFDVSHETMIQDIQANLQNLDITTNKAGKGLKKLLTMYSLIDLPAKYAAYHTRIAEGDTHAEAVEHVHKFYQYRESVPAIITKLNRLGLGDYFGYTWDSTRIWLNTIENVVTSLRRGDLRPLVGMMFSLTLPAFRYGTGGALASIAPELAVKIAASGINILPALFPGDDDWDEDKFRIATDEQVAALRDSLPSYDRDTPLAAWYEYDEDTDSWTLRWQVLGNLSAFPIEDIVRGAWQSASQDPDRTFGETILNNVREASPLALGMGYENMWRLFTGDEGLLETGYQQPGILHVARDVSKHAKEGTPIRSDWQRIVSDRVMQYVGDTFVPGQTVRAYAKIKDIQDGRDPMLGRAIDTPEWKDVGDIFYRLVRKYDMDKDTQIKALRAMVSGELASYKIEKYLAGEAGRLGMKWKQGANDIELNNSDRARENWHTLLRSIEKNVDGFRTLTKGNFTDAEIATMLKNFGDLRTSEIEYIVNGTVDDMTGEDFQFKHTALPTQRGDAEIFKYFDDTKGQSINYAELHKDLKEQGYLVGTRKSFIRRAKKLRKDWLRNQD